MLEDLRCVDRQLDHEWHRLLRSFVFDEREPWLAERATVLSYRGLGIAIRRWKLKADPDTDEPERQERDRDAHVSTTFDGAVVVDAILDAATAPGRNLAGRDTAWRMIARLHP